MKNPFSKYKLFSLFRFLKFLFIVDLMRSRSSHEISFEKVSRLNHIATEKRLPSMRSNRVFHLNGKKLINSFIYQSSKRLHF